MRLCFPCHPRLRSVTAGQMRSRSATSRPCVGSLAAESAAPSNPSAAQSRCDQARTYGSRSRSAASNSPCAVRRNCCASAFVLMGARPSLAWCGSVSSLCFTASCRQCARKASSSASRTRSSAWAAVASHLRCCSRAPRSSASQSAAVRPEPPEVEADGGPSGESLEADPRDPSGASASGRVADVGGGTNSLSSRGVSARSQDFRKSPCRAWATHGSPPTNRRVAASPCEVSSSSSTSISAEVSSVSLTGRPSTCR